MGDSKNTITVSTEHGDVLVHKMPLADYAQIIGALESLPKEIGKILEGKDFKDLSNAEALALIPEILVGSWSDLAGIIAVATDKDKQFLLELDGADAFDVIDAVLEVNDIARIITTIKKIMARGAKIKKDLKPQKQT